MIMTSVFLRLLLEPKRLKWLQGLGARGAGGLEEDTQHIVSALPGPCRGVEAFGPSGLGIPKRRGFRAGGVGFRGCKIYKV